MKISRRRIGAAIMTLAVVLGGTQVAAAAYASEAPQSSAQATIQTLQGRGLVHVDGLARGWFPDTSLESGTISTDKGLSVASRNGTVSVTPVTQSLPEHVQSGNWLVYHAGHSFDYALTTTDTGAANAGYAVLKDASAPESFRFRVSVDGHPAHLVQADDGSVLVQNDGGTTVNVIGAAWAQDAAGKDLVSSYSVSGDVLTQHVAHRNATYPVVADPALECDWLFCTVMYSKSETKTLASSVSAAASLLTAACSALGGPIAGVACGVSSAYAIDYANTALNNGKCVGVRALIYDPLPTTHLVQEKCRK